MKESQHTEWKESWRDDRLRWVSGFANAEGGVLVIGRNDDGHVVGIPDAAKLLEVLPNRIRTAAREVSQGRDYVSGHPARGDLSDSRRCSS